MITHRVGISVAQVAEPNYAKFKELEKNSFAEINVKQQTHRTVHSGVNSHTFAK